MYKQFKNTVFNHKKSILGVCLFAQEKITKKLYEFDVERESLRNLMERLSRFHKKSSNIMEIKNIFKWISSVLQDYPVNIEIIEESNFPSMVITSQKTLKPKLFLVAHIDPPQNEVTFNKKSGFDQRMAVACYLLLFQELGERLSQYDIGIMLTSDKILTSEGTNYLLDEKGYSSSFAFIPDGKPNWHVEEIPKGILQLQLISKGISSHSSRPLEGSNAILKLVETITETESFLKENNASLHIQKFVGGKSWNQVPPYAEAVCTINCHKKGNNKDMILKKMNEVTEKFDGDVQINVISISKPEIHQNMKEFDEFKNIAKKKYNIDIKPAVSHFSSDSKYFEQHGIPALVVAPKEGYINDMEKIDMNDLTKYYKVLKLWVEKIFLTITKK
eukprot:gene8371-196_t